MNFIEKVMDKPGVAASLYSIAIIAVSLITGLMGIFQDNNSAFMLIGLVVISVVLTVLPLTFLRFYSFSSFNKLMPDAKTPTFLIFAMLEVGFILLNFIVYSTAVIGTAGLGMGSLFIISIGNIIGIAIFGLIAGLLKLWKTFESSDKTQMTQKNDNTNSNPFDEIDESEDFRSDFKKTFGF